MVPPNLRNSLFDCFMANLEQYKCFRCVSFRTHFLHLLKQHIGEQHTEQKEEFLLHRCKNCAFETWSKYLIIRHNKFDICVANKRKIESGAVILSIEHDHCYYKRDTQVGDIEYSAGKFLCEFCLCRTDSLESLNLHEKDCPFSTCYKSTFKRYFEEDSHLNFLVKRLERQNYPSRTQWECDQCSYQSNFKTNLNKHKRRHLLKNKRLEERQNYPSRTQWECDQCSYKSNCESNFKQHKCEHLLKNKAKWFVCGHCPFKTLYKRVLKNHGINKHLPENKIKWFDCDQCSYKTKYESCLKNHKLLRHASKDEINWLQCDSCSYKAINRSLLGRHITYKHLSENEIKWFKCVQCSYKSKENSALKSHILNKHTPENDIKWFECEQCTYKSKQKSYLKRHVLYRHTDVKWFRCDQCSFKAKWKSDIKSHKLWKHASENDIQWFKCDQCSYKTKRNYLLNRHKLRRHFKAQP